MIIPGKNGADHPSGQFSNYRNPPTRASRLLTVHVTMIVLAAAVVALRLISRYVVVKNPGWDDHMIIVAMVNG